MLTANANSMSQAKPPVQGEPSYELWISEKTDVLESLKSRAKFAVESFNAMPGFKCNEVRVRILIIQLYTPVLLI